MATADLGNVRHCAVARLSDRIALASYSHCTVSGMPARFQETVAKVLRSSRVSENPRLSVVDREVGTINYMTFGDVIYVIITSQDYPQRTAFKLLEDLCTRFTASFGDQMAIASENGLSSKAKKLLSEVCLEFDDLGRKDAVTGAIKQVEEVQGMMRENINIMIKQGENLEVLEDRTENLRQEAHHFNRQARTLRTTMAWRNAKLRMVLCCLVFAIIGYAVTPLVMSTIETAEQWDDGD